MSKGQKLGSRPEADRTDQVALLRGDGQRVRRSWSPELGALPVKLPQGLSARSLRKRFQKRIKSPVSTERRAAPPSPSRWAGPRGPKSALLAFLSHKTAGPVHAA